MAGNDYAPPRLEVLGTVAELTLSGTNGKSDTIGGGCVQVGMTSCV